MENFCALIKGKKPVFVLFYATWCPHCQRMLPIIDKLENNKDLTLLRYDMDDENNRELIEYYHVQAVPSMMICKEGEQLWRWNGEMGEEELLGIVKRLTHTDRKA